MTADPRYPEGVTLFQVGRYFEAHEVLELAWRATPPGDHRQFLQGLIQLAVSLEHWRRGNPRGARGQWEKGRAKLEPLRPDHAGLDLAGLLADFAAFYAPRALDHWVEAQQRGEAPPPDPGPFPTPRWLSPGSPGAVPG